MEIEPNHTFMWEVWVFKVGSGGHIGQPLSLDKVGLKGQNEWIEVLML